MGIASKHDKSIEPFQVFIIILLVLVVEKTQFFRDDPYKKHKSGSKDKCNENTEETIEIEEEDGKVFW